MLNLAELDLGLGRANQNWTQQSPASYDYYKILGQVTRFVGLGTWELGPTSAQLELGLWKLLISLKLLPLLFLSLTIKLPLLSNIGS